MRLVENVYSKPVRIIEATNAQLPDGVLLRLIYPVCNIGELNANKRLYEQELWDLVLENQELQEKLSNRNLYGQAEHPKETASDLQLTSHIIHEMWIGDGRVYQTFDVLDTPCGRIIECLVRAGSKVGVSTRAEGDLEEAVNEETGEKYHRVVPKSYRYVTTDFTADPSTFGAMAVDVKKNIITAARTAAESKTSKVGEVRFARQILESLECDHKHTCQHCGACTCQGKKEEGSDMTKSTVAEAIKSGKISEGKAVSFVVKTEIGETKYTHAAVKKISEGHLDIQLNSSDPSSKSLTADGTDAVTIRPDGTMDIFASGTADQAPLQAPQEDALAAELGAEETPASEVGTGETEGEVAAEELSGLSSKKEEELPESRKINEYSNLIVDNLLGELAELFSDRGVPSQNEILEIIGQLLDVLKTKEAVVNAVEDMLQDSEGWRAEDAKALSKALKSPLSIRVTYVEGEDEDKKTSEPEIEESKTNEGAHCSAKDKKQVSAIKKSEMKSGKSKKKAEEIAFATVNKQKKESKLTEKIDDLKSVFVCSFESKSGGPIDFQVCAIFEDELRPLVLTHSNDEGEAIKTGKSLADLTKVPFEGMKTRYTIESKVTEESKSPTLDVLTDLRVKEASTRAERDALLEGRDIQVRILSRRLKLSEREVQGLRTVVENKAKALKESKKPADEVTKLNEKLTSQHVAHQKELVASSNTSVKEGRSQVLKEYFDQRLSACRLDVDDNSQALLEGCNNLADVDHLIEGLVQVARRGALHPKALKDMVIHENRSDPEQDKVDKQVGSLMKGWSA